MSSSLRLLAAVNAVLFLAAFGCGDEDGGGCGPAKEKKTEAAAPGVSGTSSNGGGRAAELVTQDKKGRVPKAYRRPGTSDADGEKSDRTISKPVIAKSTAAAAAVDAPASVTVTRRKVDGVSDRVEIRCKVMAASPDGECANAKNYEDVKRRCCPDGLVERCRTSMEGVVIIGRGCDPAP